MHAVYLVALSLIALCVGSAVATEAVFESPGLTSVPVAIAVSPTEAMKQTSDQVIQLLNNVDLGQADRAMERRQRLAEVVGQRFSYDEMSKRVLGDHWPTLTDDQRQQFVSLFRMLLTKVYASRIERYGVRSCNTSVSA